MSTLARVGWRMGSAYPGGHAGKRSARWPDSGVDINGEYTGQKKTQELLSILPVGPSMGSGLIEDRRKLALGMLIHSIVINCILWGQHPGQSLSLRWHTCGRGRTAHAQSHSQAGMEAKDGVFSREGDGRKMPQACMRPSDHVALKSRHTPAYSTSKIFGVSASLKVPSEESNAAGTASSTSRAAGERALFPFVLQCREGHRESLMSFLFIPGLLAETCPKARISEARNKPWSCLGHIPQDETQRTAGSPVTECWEAWAWILGLRLWL